MAVRHPPLGMCMHEVLRGSLQDTWRGRWGRLQRQWLLPTQWAVTMDRVVGLAHPQLLRLFFSCACHTCACHTWSWRPCSVVSRQPLCSKLCWDQNLGRGGGSGCVRCWADSTSSLLGGHGVVRLMQWAHCCHICLIWGQPGKLPGIKQHSVISGATSCQSGGASNPRQPLGSKGGFPLGTERVGVLLLGC